MSGSTFEEGIRCHKVREMLMSLGPLQRGGAGVSGTGSGCRMSRPGLCNANIALAGGEVCDPWSPAVSHREDTQGPAAAQNEACIPSLPYSSIWPKGQSSSGLWQRL